MDPDETLRQIRAKVEEIHGDPNDYAHGSDAWNAWQDHAEELSELVAGLDDWLSRGGFPPQAWRPAGDRHV